MHPSPNGKAAAMYPAHRPPGPVGLTRFGSAPGSLLTTLVDSVVGGAGAVASGRSSGGEFSASENMVGRFFTGESPCLTSESSCKATGVPPELDPEGAYGKRKAAGGAGLGLENAYGMNEMAMGDLAMGVGGGLRTGSSPLIRHSSSPAGFLSHLMVDNGFSVTRGGSYAHAGAENVHAMDNRRLKSQLSFSSRQDSLSQISEVSIPDVGESVGGSSSSDEAAGTVGQSFISSNFHVGSWDETNSIVFSAPPGKRGKDNNGDIITSLGSMDPSQFGLQNSALEMETLLQLPQDSVPCKIRAKRGCATHPRSIAERERRTRISEKLRKLQELVPNMDKQTSTSDMLDLAVQYIKNLQGQIEIRRVRKRRSEKKISNVKHAILLDNKMVTAVYTKLNLFNFRKESCDKSEWEVYMKFEVKSNGYTPSLSFVCFGTYSCCSLSPVNLLFSGPPLSMFFLFRS